jgi:hypothetical protein
MPQIIISINVILPLPVVPVLVRLCQATSAAMACQGPQTPAGPSAEMVRWPAKNNVTPPTLAVLTVQSSRAGGASPARTSLLHLAKKSVVMDLTLGLLPAMTATRWMVMAVIRGAESSLASDVKAGQPAALTDASQSVGTASGSQTRGGMMEILRAVMGVVQSARLKMDTCVLVDYKRVLISVGFTLDQRLQI